MFACKTCGLTLSAEHYRIHKRGYRIGKCRSCEAAYQRAFYANGGEKTRTRKREYMASLRMEKPNEIRAYQSAYRSKHRERINAKTTRPPAKSSAPTTSATSARSASAARASCASATED